MSYCNVLFLHLPQRAVSLCDYATLLISLLTQIILPQVQRSLGTSPDILYLSAVLGRMKNQPSDVILGTVLYLSLNLS